MPKNDKTLKQKMDEARKAEAARAAEVKSIQAPESTFKVEAPPTYSETPKEPGKVRSFIEDKILPTVRGTAEEVGSMVLGRDIALSEAPAMFKEGLKYNFKQDVQNELENFINESILGRINKKLPFDIKYSSRPGAQPGLRGADMTVGAPREDKAIEEARKRGMIK